MTTRRELEPGTIVENLQGSQLIVGADGCLRPRFEPQISIRTSEDELPPSPPRRYVGCPGWVFDAEGYLRHI